VSRAASSRLTSISDMRDTVETEASLEAASSLGGLPALRPAASARSNHHTRPMMRGRARKHQKTRMPPKKVRGTTQWRGHRHAGLVTAIRHYKVAFLDSATPHNRAGRRATRETEGRTIPWSCSWPPRRRPSTRSQRHLSEAAACPARSQARTKLLARCPRHGANRSIHRVKPWALPSPVHSGISQGKTSDSSQCSDDYTICMPLPRAPDLFDTSCLIQIMTHKDDRAQTSPQPEQCPSTKSPAFVNPRSPTTY
jgi:hypothetical protein